jgi:hypothetical protein
MCRGVSANCIVVEGEHEISPFKAHPTTPTKICRFVGCSAFSEQAYDCQNNTSIVLIGTIQNL